MITSPAWPAIALDVTPALLQGAGVARYVREATTQLLADYAGRFAFSLFACGRVGSIPARWEGVPWHRWPGSPRAWRLALGVGHLLRRRIAPGLPATDLFHALDTAFPYAPGSQVLVTIHDLSVVRYPHYHRPLNRLFLSLMLRATARRGHPVTVPSQFTNREVQVLLGIPAERITVIPPGVAAEFFVEPSAEELAAVRARYQLPEQFVLSVGTLEPRKNLALLARAVARAGKVTLIVVGAKGWGAGVPTHWGEVRWLGHVPDSHLRCLYRLATVVAYPSVYEGFGLPVAEAIVNGAVVVCAEAGALPEAAGGAALLLDPRAEDEWGEAIRSLLTEPERRSALQERAVARREELHRYRMGAALAELYGKVLGPATAG